MKKFIPLVVLIVGCMPIEDTQVAKIEVTKIEDEVTQFETKLASSLNETVDELGRVSFELSKITKERIKSNVLLSHMRRCNDTKGIEKMEQLTLKLTMRSAMLRGKNLELIKRFDEIYQECLEWDKVRPGWYRRSINLGGIMLEPENKEITLEECTPEQLRAARERIKAPLVEEIKAPEPIVKFD
jgi:hypothetical protein